MATKQSSPQPDAEEQTLLSTAEVEKAMTAAINSTVDGMNMTARVVNSEDKGEIYSSMEASEASVYKSVHSQQIDSRE